MIRMPGSFIQPLLVRSADGRKPKDVLLNRRGVARAE
jgi:hypothetical protein